MPNWNGKLAELFDPEITSHSEKSFDPEQPFANHLAGAEGQVGEGDFDLSDFIRECPEQFFHALPILRPEDREIVIEYYLLRKPQVWIARIHGKTQTLVWQELERFGRVICAALLFGPEPSEERIRGILVSQALERIGVDFRQLSLAKIIFTLAQRKHLQLTCKVLRLSPAFIRRAIGYAALRLSTGNVEQRAMGDYLSYLVYRIHAYHAPISIERRKKARALRVLRFKDPKILGRYEIDVRSQDFRSLCPSRAAV